MSSAQNGSASGDRGISPADLHNVRFTRAPLLRPGYVDAEVDRIMHRVAEELARHIAEKAQLRDQVRALQAQVEGVSAQAPSEQAVRILSTAQQTADAYVAEAEEFSRQMTSEARATYEEEVRQARENAGAMIQAAQEAARKISGGVSAGADTPARSVEQLEEQVAYLKAFGQACRVQLRSYLEALLADIETEWGRADPAALPLEPQRPPTQRSRREGSEPSATFTDNTVAETPNDRAEDGRPATTVSRSAS